MQSHPELNQTEPCNNTAPDRRLSGNLKPEPIRDLSDSFLSLRDIQFPSQLFLDIPTLPIPVLTLSHEPGFFLQWSHLINLRNHDCIKPREETIFPICGEYIGIPMLEPTANKRALPAHLLTQGHRSSVMVLLHAQGMVPIHNSCVLVCESLHTASPIIRGT